MQHGMQKVLVANRGEIAIRIMRAAVELGMSTVAVYTHPDREGLHRVKADEAYEIGDPKRPLAGYLDPEAIVDAAVRAGADAVHPGYGFLSESPDLARACADAGIVFVGPPAEVLELTGDKVRARHAAQQAGVPVLDASEALDTDERALAEAERLGYPVFVKAAAGGGGRGLRLVEDAEHLLPALAAARREAEGAFADATVFLEQAVVDPRHIEVQVLADADGDVLHLYERDCSLQRRHQKVLEIAPAPHLSPELRERLCEDALRFARAVGYRNAGTVEFLLDRDGRHVLIEMNPRIQVEHTVTEEITDVDLVAAQLRIADGATFEELGLAQERIEIRGVALQCRVTTEDPAKGFRPDTGTITAYRSTGGAGIRLDVGSAFVGATVSPYFDPLLLKLTARASTLELAAARARRGLQEFRVRGVATNTAFLRAILQHPEFLRGEIDTGFIARHPEVSEASAGRDRTSRLLQYVAEMTVNSPHGDAPTHVDPRSKLPEPATGAATEGSRERLDRMGPDGFATWLRELDRVAITDTTFRDAHQSLLATRLRTLDMLAVLPHMGGVLHDALSLEVWGGATFDATLRFLHEDPWERLELLREGLPDICLQMLLRGANAVGYSEYPDQVVRAFVEEAAGTGIDIFRVFDALNDVDRMRAAIAAVRGAGKLAEGTLCYTGDLADPDEGRYTLDHYLGVAERLDEAGAHVLCIKDMAGVLRAPAAYRLVTALRERFPQPVHLHTHDTAGGQVATYLAAIEAGVDAVDVAAAPMAGGTSQPSASAVVAATAGGPRETGLSLDHLRELEPYWEAVRSLYTPFDAGLRAPSGAVYRHQIPGGQLSNLRQQAIGLGLGDRFEEVEHAYVEADRLLGGLIKVTPTSKVVGDLALFMLSTGLGPDAILEDPVGADLPGSVIGFLRGELGEPPFGWPEPLRSRLLGPDPHHEAPQLEEQDLDALADPSQRRERLTTLLFPAPAAAQRSAVTEYGEVWRLPTDVFFHGLAPDVEAAVDLEPGKQLAIELEAVSEPDEKGYRTVWCKVNGQLRPVEVLDTSVAGATTPSVERADPGDPRQIAAPMTGVVTVEVSPGTRVERGATVATIEAMKMETNITTPVAGTIARVAVSTGTHLEAGDLVAVVDEPGSEDAGTEDADEG